jgi:hypothetical protein
MTNQCMCVYNVFITYYLAIQSFIFDSDNLIHTHTHTHTHTRTTVLFSFYYGVYVSHLNQHTQFLCVFKQWNFI